MTDTTTQPAYELDGHDGQFRVPGGRTVYEGVFNCAPRGDGFKLQRFDTSDGRLRVVTRYIDADAAVEVLRDFTAEHEADIAAEASRLTGGAG